MLHDPLWNRVFRHFSACASNFFPTCFFRIFCIQVVKINPAVFGDYSFDEIHKALPRNVVAAFLPVKHRLDKMVGMKDFFSKDFAAVMKVVHTYPTAVLREENVDVTVGRVAVQLSLDVAPKTAMAVT